MMNSELVMDSADAIARYLLDQTEDDTGRVRLAYERAVGRPPTEVELHRALAFVNDSVSRQSDSTTVGKDNDRSGEGLAKGRQRVWSLFCQSLIASNEFMYLR